MLETAFNSSVDVAKAKMAVRGVKLNVISQIVPLYDSFETQHLGKKKTHSYCNSTHLSTLKKNQEENLLSQQFKNKKNYENNDAIVLKFT